MNKTKTYEEVVRQASSFLNENHRDEEIAYYLLLGLKHWKVEDWYLNRYHDMPKQDQEIFSSAIQTIVKNRLPYQYYLHEAWFYDHSFYVDQRVLIPRNETEELVDHVLSWVKEGKLSTSSKVLDLGTGSGAIGLTLKKWQPDFEVTLSDISKEALDVAKKNAERLEAKVKVVESDLFDHLKEESFDLIVSNPPYIAKSEMPLMGEDVLKHEPKLALFSENEGLAFYERLKEEILIHLRPKGIFIGEMGFRQGKRLEALFKDLEKVDVKILQDLSHHDRFVVVEKLYMNCCVTIGGNMTKRYKKSEVKEAAEALRKGKLVAFPTETVFGLGAIANNEEAVKSVYTVKGRPSDNPLIVHVARKEDLFKYSEGLNEERFQLAEQLIRTFWPGPLTLVVPVKAGVFGPTVTGGLDTVGIRMPDQDFTLEVIKETGFPLVGPSANLSTKPSPTTVEHVLHDFDGKINGVLDAEPTTIGVESTVLDLSDPAGIYILRPGYITKKMLEEKINGLHISTQKKVDPKTVVRPKAPGMKYRHYSPNQTVYAVSREKFEEVVALHPGKETAIIASEAYLKTAKEGQKTFSLGENSKEMTHLLFSGLREFDDDPSIKVLIVELLPDEEGNQAYRNRLMKASSEVIE